MRSEAMMKRKFLTGLLIVAILVLSAACGNGKYAESGSLIVEADEALSMYAAGWILVDAQKATSFAKEHIAGAVNIERKQITEKRNVPNMLASAEKVAAAAGRAGLESDSNLLIYDDNNNMDAARLAWTMMIYGHKGGIRLVSGGFSALTAAGAGVDKGKASVKASAYRTGGYDDSMIIDKEGILDVIDSSPERSAIIDVRSDEEWNAGTIPGAVQIEYLKNNFRDGTYRPVQHIRILYKDAGIMPEDGIIIFCKSSIRAAQTWAALYNAGYRNLMIYDGAWLEWSADESLPVYKPVVSGEIRIQVQDAS